MYLKILQWRKITITEHYDPGYQDWSDLQKPYMELVSEPWCDTSSNNIEITPGMHCKLCHNKAINQQPQRYTPHSPPPPPPPPSSVTALCHSSLKVVVSEIIVRAIPQTSKPDIGYKAPWPDDIRYTLYPSSSMWCWIWHSYILHHA